jgi:HPt (histidine-containing phosphotransfer) domain-containing protein
LNKPFPVAVDPEILDLAEGFINNRRSQINTWREAAAVGNARLLHRLGHEVKGTAGAFGLKIMSELGAQLERTVANGNLEGMGDAVERMIDFICRVEVVPR